MTLPDTTDEGTTIFSFKTARWSTRVLLIGICGLVLARSVALLPPAWFEGMNPSVLMILATFLLHGFLLSFPLVKRASSGVENLQFPTLTRCVAELRPTISAVVVVLGCAIAASYLIQFVSPATRATSNSITVIARIQEPFALYSLLVLMVVVARFQKKCFFEDFCSTHLKHECPVGWLSWFRECFFGFAIRLAWPTLSLHQYWELDLRLPSWDGHLN